MHMMGDNEAWFDTRRTARLSVYRPVLIRTGQVTSFGLMRELSSVGIRAKVYTQFPEQVPVTVYFDAKLALTATILWHAEDQIGVAFDEPLDPSDLLGQISHVDATGAIVRPARLPITVQGEVHIEREKYPVQVRDISQRGARVTGSPLQPGDAVRLRIDGLEARQATVRWLRGGVAGVNFARALSFDELAGWAIELQERSSLTGNSEQIDRALIRRSR